jgi:AcrR family transcriptional regulator
MSEVPSRTQENRRALFEAAIRLFREKGFAATSADEIAARAGCSRATFFNHFGSKSAVLRSFGQDLEARVGTLLEHRPAGASALSELRRILLAMAAEAEKQRENLKIVLVHSLEDGSYFSAPSPARAKILQHVAALIGEAQRAGEARTDLPAPHLAAQIIGLYNHAVIGVLFANQPATSAIAHLWEFALGGLTGAGDTAVPARGRARRQRR